MASVLALALTHKHTQGGCGGRGGWQLDELNKQHDDTAAAASTSICSGQRLGLINRESILRNPRVALAYAAPPITLLKPSGGLESQNFGSGFSGVNGEIEEEVLVLD